MKNTELVEIQNQQIKGVTFKLGWQLFASTIVITATLVSGFYSIIARMDKQDMQAKIRQTEVDGKFERIEMKVDNTSTEFDRRISLVESKHK